MNARELNGRRATGGRIGGSKRSHTTGVVHELAGDPELVLLDHRLLQRLRVDRGLTMNQVKDQLDDIDNGDTVSRTTVDRAFNGNGVRPDKAKVIADLFGRTVLQLLSPSDPRYELPVQVADGVPWEWEIESFLQPGGIETSNGLHYFLCKMRHRHTAGRFGRGKFYLLSGLSAEERVRKREQLQRHAEVCARIGRHANLAENESSTPIRDDSGWWIVDRWVESTPLSRILGSDELPGALPQVMREIVDALARLHECGVVMRELAPSRILITAETFHAVLSDFELAKLLAGAPTVSPNGDWPDDPYRAPEVESGILSPAADFFSWGRILLHAFAGTLPPKGLDLDLLATIGLPKAIWRVTHDCLQLDPSKRPQCAADLIRLIQKWK